MPKAEATKPAKTTTPATKERFGAERRTNLFWYAAEALSLIDDPAHPLFDERLGLEIDERLVRSIMAQGVMTPITVRKVGDTIEVVDGRQRVRATREANKRLTADGELPIQVPAVPVRGTPEDLMVIMVSANELRREDDPITKARKMDRMLKRGAVMETVVDAFGCSRQTVGSYLDLLECSPVVQEAVKGGMAIHIARKLKALPAAEQEKTLAELQASGGVGGKAALDKVGEKVGDKGRSRAKAVKSRPWTDVDKARKTLLDEKGGTRVYKLQRDAIIAALAWVQGEDDAIRTILSESAEVEV